MKNLSPALIDAIRNGSPSVILVEFLLGTPLYITSSSVELNWDAKTWVPAPFVDEPKIELTSEAKISPIEITLSAAENEYVTYFKTNQHRNHRVNVYFAYLDHSYNIIDQPIALYQGLIESAAVNDSVDSSTIQIKCSSIWRDFERTAGRRTNNNSNHKYYPDDDGFFATSIDMADLPWGKDGQISNVVYDPETGGVK